MNRMLPNSTRPANLVRHGLVAFALLLAIGACNGESDRAVNQVIETETTRVAPADPSDISWIELPAELDRVLRDYEEGWRAGDEDRLASLFAPDGFILRPGHPPVRGRDSIRVAYANSIGPLYLHAYDFDMSGPTGFIIGGYGHAPDAADTGKYILALRRLDDRKWYIAADMDNGN